MIRSALTALFSTVLLVLISCGDDLTDPGYVNPDYPDNLERVISTFGRPSGIAVSDFNGLAYVPAPMSYCVYAVSAMAREPVDTLNVEYSPNLVTSIPGSGEIWVSAWPNPLIMVIDPSTNTVVHTIDTGDQGISALLSSPDGAYVFAGCIDNKALHVLQTSDYGSEGVFNLEWAPTIMAVSPGGERLYVANDSKKEIQEIILSSMTLGTLYEDLPETVRLLATTADGENLLLFGRRNYDPRVFVLRLADGSIIDDIRTRQLYDSSARIPGTGTILLVRRSDNKLSILNMENMVFAPTLAAGNDPSGVAVSPDGQEIWISNRLGNSVYLYGYAE